MFLSPCLKKYSSDTYETTSQKKLYLEKYLFECEILLERRI